MTRDGLLRDLKTLHHGRGLRRPHVRTWLGPSLLNMLGARPDTTDAELRSGLARLLTRHSQPLPDDLRYLFRIAAGLGADRAVLEERLQLASDALDRSVRVLRRWLRAAEVLVADSLLHQRGDGSNWWEAPGWQWLGLAAHLVVREDAVLRLDQQVLALTAQPKFLHEMFTLPESVNDAEVSFESVSGLEIVQVERTSQTVWRVSIELPHDLVGGETAETSLLIRVSDAATLQPYVALAPVRECSRIEMSVDFGEDADATIWWDLEGVLPTELGSLVREGTVCGEPAVGVVSRTFERPRVGLAHGLAWRRRA